MTTFSLVPEENRVFTTTEIRQAVGCSKTLVMAFAKRKGFKPLNDNYKNGVMAQWDYNFYKSFCNYFKALREKQQKQAEKRKKITENEPPEENKSIEELKRLHPLVTDERCFKLNWWPEVIPNNLIDFV